MIIRIIILIFAVIGFVFIFNPGDISPFSLPCPSACGEQCGFHLLIFEPEPCEEIAEPYASCYKVCRMRNFKCDINQEFKEECLDCIDDCQSEKNKEECFKKCTA